MKARLVVVVALVMACGPKAVPVGTPQKIDAGTGAGSGSGTVPDADPKDPLAAAVERIVTLYEAIAKLPPAGSCHDAATAIDQWTGERVAALAQVREAAKGSQAQLVDGLFIDASPRLSIAMKAVEELATRCSTEPAVGAALARLSMEDGK